MIWKPVLAFTGVYGYGVSDCGKVRNTRTGLELKLNPDKDGYLLVALWNDGRSHYFKVHRLVALAFLPNPDNKPQVNHVDGCRTHNAVQNLEWVTALENIRHTIASGRQGKMPSRKILARCGDQVEIFESTKAAQRAGHNRAALYLCLTGKQKHHHGRTWEYA